MVCTRCQYKLNDQIAHYLPNGFGPLCPECDWIARDLYYEQKECPEDFSKILSERFEELLA